MKIYKYRVPFPDNFNDNVIIVMPIISTILSFNSQNHILYIWALVDPNSTDEERKFRLLPTGFTEINKDDIKKFIGTVQDEDGERKLMVWHLFEIQ